MPETIYSTDELVAELRSMARNLSNDRPDNSNYRPVEAATLFVAADRLEALDKIAKGKLVRPHQTLTKELGLDK